MPLLRLTLVILGLFSAGASEQEARPSVPVDPVTGILDAFREYTIVALGEGTHGNEQGAAFRQTLVRDPRFAGVVNDIVVESGNSRYQEVMDRYVHGGDVPGAILRQVWQNTTQPHTLWDVPIYEEFFRTVRDVNLQLPHQRHLRVILGDPPIDWDALRTAEEHRAWIATPIAHRDRFPFEVIQREVVARKRRALVIYGDLHFNRWNPQVPPGAADRSNNIVDLLEQSGVKVFSIHTSTIRVDLRTLQQDIGSWPKPSLSILEGTTLGAADFTTYYPAPNLKAADGRPLFPRPMAQQFDAVLYLGSPSEITQSRLSPALCADAAYMTMRRGRINLLGMKRDLERLDEQCRTVRN